MKYALFDEKGLPKAFYDSNIHKQIPEEATQITDEQWLELIQNQGRRAFVNGEVIDITNKVWDEESGTWREKSEDEMLAEKVSHMKASISGYTDSYIRQKLQEIDEDLADITSEAQVIEGKILYIAAKEGITVTTDEVKQKVALFVAGDYTQEQAISDLQEKGLSEEAIQSILPLLSRAVEIARILNWKEEVWQKEGELEAQIDTMTLEELLSLDVKRLYQETYSKIPLEVSGD
jgi:hypothetical protein